MENLILEQQRRVVQVGSKLKQNEPEVTAYISGLVTPLSSPQIVKLNTFVRALKTGLSISALSDAFDVMYILANETAESGLRNLVKRAHDAQAVNSPTFTALEGFAGNGTSSYIDTKYAPSTQGVKFSAENAAFGMYQRNNLNDNTCIGRRITSYTELFTRTSSLFVIRINSSASANIASNNNSMGMFSATRTGTSGTGYINKTRSIDVTLAGNTISAGNMYIISNGESFGAGQISFAYFARSLSQTDINAVLDAIEAYMDSNGKGVIS